LVADIREQFEAVRRGVSLAKAEVKSKRQRQLDALLTDITELKHQVDAGELDVCIFGKPEDTYVTNPADGTKHPEEPMSYVKDYLIDQVDKLFPDPDDRGGRELAIAVRGIDDPTMVMLKDAIADYLREKKQYVTKRTLRSKERRLQAFQKWLDDDHGLLNAVDRRGAGNYTQAFTRRIEAGDLAPKTAKDTLADLSAFYKWCKVRGHITSNPFADQASTIHTSTRGTAEKPRRTWTTEELLKFHNTVPPTSKAWALATLSQYTGARVSEVCALKVENVVDGCLRITEGKTQSAVRAIPVHPVIRPLVQHLMQTTTDGYLLPGLTSGGPDDTRGASLQDKLRSTIRDKAGITDRRVVPHTLRNGFITALERAGVPPHEIQLLVGHKRGSVTLDVYSEGAGLERLKDAVGKVNFGEVDELVAGRIGELVS